MVEQASVRVVLYMAAVHKWHIHQIDVKNAFLNDCLQETVYISQPRSFKNAALPSHVCNLNKVLYCLKQAPHTWVDLFSAFLFTLGFHSSNEDSSLFVLKKESDIVILLLYVDDVLIIGDSSSLLMTFLRQFKQEFAMKDLQVHYSLGIQIQTTDDGLFLSQQSYPTNLLSKTNFWDCKPTDAPMAYKM